MRAWPARIAVSLPLLGSLLFAASCDSSGQEATHAAPSAAAARLYGADGNMNDSFGDAFKDRPGALNGMKGTTPLTQLSADFKRQLLAVDPRLAHFNYTGEAYDAVVIAALAAEYAQTTDPAVIAKHLVGVTTGGMTCDSVAACLPLAKQGKDLEYRGIALRRGGLTDAGEPSSASYGVVSFGRDNHIDEGRTEFVPAGDERSQSKVPAPAVKRVSKTTAPLKIGGLLPHSGRLSSFGPPLMAAALLATNDLNAAGGVLSSNVIWVDGDDGTNPQTALATVDRLVGEGVQVIVGAGASGVTRAVIPKIVATGRVLISPTSTADELTTAEDAGLFFRTAPPDSLQARALADMIMRDGPRRVAIIAIDESYGTGLAEGVQSNLLLAGLAASDIRTVTYPTKDRYNTGLDVADIFNPIAVGIRAFGPSAILVIGSDESAHVVRSLLP